MTAKHGRSPADGAPRGGPLLISSALFLIALCGGCAAPKSEKGTGRPAAPPVAVSIGVATERDVPVTVEAVGSVEALNSVAVRARVGGELLRVAFVEGQNVRKGELLFVIDPRPYRAALAQAEADLARDRARAISAEADAGRYAELVDKDYVTRQQADQVKATFDAARATLRADSAAVETARLNLGYCTIHAPISGRTGSLLLHEGNLVKANDDNPLVVINQIAPARVSLAVPESYLPLLQSRMAGAPIPVTVRAPGDSSRAVSGTLSFLDNAVDETTGQVRLKALFPNADESLWPGQFVQASVELEIQSGVVVVPTPALLPGQAGRFVYVVKADQTVEVRPVTAGRAVGGFTVLESGVRPGEQVVTDGQMRLTAGSRVVVKPAVGAPPAGPKS